MLVLTNVLYWIATALLIPVMVSLIIIFVITLMMLGGFYGRYTKRLHFKKVKTKLLAQCREQQTLAIPAEKINTYRFFYYLEEAEKSGWHSLLTTKLTADFEMECQKELEKPKTIMRLGPMLGLMGTLIPMGPALVGLASGDIQSMAVNMQVAFSTTVVGIFVGAMGFVIQLVRQRWTIEDLNDLQFIMEISQKKGVHDGT